MEAAPEPAAAVASPPAARAAAAPTKPFDARQVYRCNSCNVLGHWSQDNKCRPADVQANLARLTALLAPPPPAAAEPVAGPSTGKTEFDRPILFVLALPLRALLRDLAGLRDTHRALFSVS